MNLLDLLFPKSCLGCGKVGGYLCSTCILNLEKPKLICPVCEKQQPFGETHSFCKTTSSLDGLVYFYNYQGIIQTAIHKLKYRYVTELSSEINQKIITNLVNDKTKTLFLQKLLAHKSIVVPIPLYWYKENQRGFNQSSLFGQAVARQFNLPFSNQLIIRNKPRVSQTKLSYKDREKNAEGIFSVASRSPIVDFCLLVDDVWTTGSTMKEACRILREAGTREVWGMTIAR